MKIIKFNDIVKKIENTCIDINYNATIELAKLYDNSIKKEHGYSSLIMKALKKNIFLAKKYKIPICQDTGTLVVFVNIGDKVIIEGGFLEKAILDGVENGYKNGYLRKSIVKDPFNRINTKNNLPPIIHYKLVEGEILTFDICAKGGGSENMSFLKMLKPSNGKYGVEKFILKKISKVATNACPPIFIGIGIGSNFEGVALLAKKALLIPINKENPNLKLKKMEKNLEKKINKMKIGPQGLGGKITVFKIKILTEPCHIASLPLAVNINCHVHRYKRIVF